MTPLGLLRHGRTEWNAQGRMQGWADPPICPEGIRALEGAGLPPTFAAARVYVSPLLRARQTAALLGRDDFIVEPRLIEMDWGRCEGLTLAEIRAQAGPDFAANEARGLDFRPPGGESPRDLQVRLAPWLAEIAHQTAPVFAITHKGVIRALIAEAFAWDMIGKPPFRIDWNRAQVLRIDARGQPHPGPANLALDRPTSDRCAT